MTVTKEKTNLTAIEIIDLLEQDYTEWISNCESYVLGTSKIIDGQCKYFEQIANSIEELPF